MEVNPQIDNSAIANGGIDNFTEAMIGLVREQQSTPTLTQQKGENPPAFFNTNSSGAPTLEAPNPAANSGGNDNLLIEILLAKIETADLKTKNSEANAKVNAQLSQDYREHITQKMDELREKMEQKERGGLFSKIFGWVATVASFVVAAVLTATVVGAPAGALMMAGATIGLVNQISMETGNWFAKGVAELVSVFAPDDMTQAEKENIANWVITGVSLALSLGGAAVAASAKIAQMAGKMADMMKGAGNSIAQTGAIGSRVVDGLTVIAKTLQAIASKLGTAIKEAGKAITTPIANMLKGTADILKQMAKAIAEYLPKLSAKSAEAAKGAGAVGKDVAEEVASEGAKRMDKIANTALGVGMMTTGVGAVGKGSADIYVAHIAEDAELIQADTVKMDALVEWFSEKVQHAIDDYHHSMNDLFRGISSVGKMLEGMNQSKTFATRI